MPFSANTKKLTAISLYMHLTFVHFILTRLVIHSPDTDVAVICCYSHTLRCDSTSSFHGIGKKKTFTILKNKKEQLFHLIDVGDTAVISYESDCVVDAIKFVCWLYDPMCKHFDINTLRYLLFCQKNVWGEKLPPTLHALLLHISRAACQTYIWKNANCQILNLESPVENGGRKYINQILIQKLMTKDPAPSQIIELVVCRCKSGCKRNTWSCREKVWYVPMLAVVLSVKTQKLIIISILMMMMKKYNIIMDFYVTIHYLLLFRDWYIIYYLQTYIYV